MRRFGSWTVLLSESAVQGSDVDSLVRRAGLDPGQARAELERRVAAGEAVVVGARAFAAPVVSDLRQRAESELGRFHRDHPGEPGMPRETLRTRVAARAAVDLFDFVLAGLSGSGLTRGTERVCPCEPPA